MYGKFILLSFLLCFKNISDRYNILLNIFKVRLIFFFLGIREFDNYILYIKYFSDFLYTLN